MAAACPMCGEGVLREDDLTECPECGTLVNTPRPGATRAKWIATAIDLVAAAIADAGQAQDWVYDEDIDRWMLANQRAFIDQLPHVTLDPKLGNCRGFFNADWTVGSNPHRGRFDREPHRSTYRLRTKREGSES